MYNTAIGYIFILIGGIIASCMIGLKFKSSKLYSDFITGKDYSIVKYLLNREYFSFQKRTFKIDGLNFAIYFKSRVFLQNLYLFTCSLARTDCTSSVVETTCGVQF